MNRDDDERDPRSPRPRPSALGDEAAWALLADSLEPQTPPPALRARLLATLSGPERFAPFVDAVARGFELNAAGVREALRKVDDVAAWQRGFLPDSSILVLPALLGTQTIVSRLNARSRIGQHRHEQRELTFVLDGALLDGSGQKFVPGDLIDMAPGSAHQLQVVGEHDCLVVFSVRAPSSKP
jgi:quercetin dioxygenase-like cupin family protein